MNNISESAKRRSFNNVSSSVVSYAKCETINYHSSELRCNIFKTFRIDSITRYSHALSSNGFEQIRGWIVLWIETRLINTLNIKFFFLRNY